MGCYNQERHGAQSNYYVFGLKGCPLGNGYIMDMWASVKATAVKARIVPKMRRHLLLNERSILFVLLLMWVTKSAVDRSAMKS
jgi:hypothetical protein